MVVIQPRVINPQGPSIPIFMIHTTPLDGSYIENSLSNVDNHPIHIIDLPFHGRSQDVAHEDLSFEEMANMIEEYRKSTGISQIGIYAHGIGGFIGITFATLFNKSVKFVILSNTAINSAYREKMAWNIRSKYSNETKDQFDRYYGSMDPESLMKRFRKSLAAHFHPISTEKAEILLQNCDRVATEAYVIIAYYHIPDYNMRGRARKIKQPTLILGGAYDIWPVEEVKRIKKEIPQGKLHFFPTGHFPMVDLPEKYWDVVFNWIEEQAG